METLVSQYPNFEGLHMEKILGVQGEQVRHLYEDNFEAIMRAPGSRAKHQAFEGGYVEHMRQVSSFIVANYDFLTDEGMMRTLELSERFSLSEALAVGLLHDIEKPFAYVQFDDGRFELNDQLKHKADREQFRNDLLDRYGLKLNRNQRNAMRYAEGLRDADYSPYERVMTPMATLVHMADLYSSGIGYAYRQD